jgi:hypothetical protein
MTHLIGILIEYVQIFFCEIIFVLDFFTKYISSINGTRVECFE